MVLMRAPLASRAALRASAAAPRAFSTATAGVIPVAAIDDGRGAASITVALKAGPRLQAPNQAGAAAALKHWLFQANDKRSALATIREAELRGGVLSTSIGKEHVLLHAGFLPEDTEFFIELLSDALTSPKLYPWEYSEHVLPALAAETESALADARVAGLDALTHAAYHGKGPGASLFASPASPLSYETATQYIKSQLTTDNVSVAAAGVPLDELTALVGQTLAALPSGTKTSSTATYYGGEARVPLASHGAPQEFFLTYDAAPLVGKPELAVLSQLLGGQTYIKWSKGQSLLSKVSHEVAGAKAAPLYIPFENAGLFGVQVSSPSAADAQVAIQTAYNALKDLATSAPEERVRAAVAQAKFAAASHFEGHAASELAATEIASGRKIETLDAHLAALEVSPSAVSSAAATLLSGKPSTAAVGDVYKLPYAADLL